MDAARIAAALGEGAVVGRRIEMHPSVSSTNDVAAALGAAGEAEGVVVAAESQGSGRGRRGRAWMSQPGRNLLFSVLLRPPGGPGDWTWLVHGAAVAVCRVVEAFGGIPAGIKWPNDVFLPGNRKVCGILMETSAGAGGGYAVLGIGLNVNERDFAGELAASAVSLAGACGEEDFDREELLAALLAELDRIYRGSAADREEALREAERRSVLLGRRIAVGEGEGRVEGRFLGLDEGGGLRVSVEGGGERIFHSAESVQLIDGN